MNNKWDTPSTKDRVLHVVRILLSIAIVVLASLQLLGILESAIDFAVPLLGAYLFILSLQEWKQKRGSAILSICIAVFIFMCSISVWLSK